MEAGMEGEPSKPRRSWGAPEQKIVGARQSWRCAHCGCLLPACYEVDHKTPLWEDGRDCIDTNAEALCNNCHGIKTQKESIRRRDLYRARLEAGVAAAQAANATEEEALKTRPHKRRRNREDEWNAREALLENPFLRYVFVDQRRRTLAEVESVK